jgi:hypothetical protein
MATKKYTAEQLRKAKEIVDQEEAIRAERVRRLKSGAKTQAKVAAQATAKRVNDVGRGLRKLVYPLAIAGFVAFTLVVFRQQVITNCLDRYQKAYEISLANDTWVYPKGLERSTWLERKPWATIECADWAGWVFPGSFLSHPAFQLERDNPQP